MKVDSGEQIIKNSELIKRFFPYFKKYKYFFVLDLACALMTTLCELVLPLIVRFITESAINDISALTLSVILKLGALYMMLRIIDTVANYIMQSVGHVTGAKIETDMRRDLFAHLNKLPFSYYDDTKIGQIMARITSDLFDITEFAHHCPEEFFIAGIKITGSFIILAGFNIYLTLIMFAVLPLMLICTMYFRRRMRRANKKSRYQIGEINSQVEDSLLGVRVVKSFANEDIEKEKFELGNGKFLKIKREMYKYMAGFHATTRMFDGVMYIIIVTVGAIFIKEQKITAADYTAYLLYVSTLLTSIRRVVEFSEQFQRGTTGIERFLEIMDTPPAIEDKEDAIEIKDVKGDIVFEHVDFAYTDNTEKVLTDINIHIKPGESIALVGPSGGGKTTLCSLIPRFYEATGGRILIDGNDVRDVTLYSLRMNIGVVQQDVYLFSGSVYENIEYGLPGANKEDIVEAAKKAGAHEFIMQLPDGYDTYVGERGVKLSGGQKQRISIARAFLKNPPVMILDEATSSLDNESEFVVQKSLENLAKGRTTLTIAHRLSTIKNAKKILVLTEDGIAETGTHDELMEKRGLYYELYNLSRFDLEE